MALERLWAGWRSEYLRSVTDAPSGPTGEDGCVFCRILASGEPDDATYVVWRGRTSFAVLNAFPYASGHLLVLPYRHVGALQELEGVEAGEVWDGVRAGVAAVTAAYRPDGLNVGANLGKAAGAGVPGHLHLHVVPRWSGDTNFMTSVAEARVLPEALPATWDRLRACWPAAPGSPEQPGPP